MPVGAPLFKDAEFAIKWKKTVTRVTHLLHQTLQLYFCVTSSCYETLCCQCSVAKMHPLPCRYSDIACMFHRGCILLIFHCEIDHIVRPSS